jgi:hypothetical protein
MLNSLYGRFGLNYFKNISKLVNHKEALDIFKKYKVLENDVFDKDTGLEYIRYTKEPSDILENLNFAEYLKVKNENETENNHIIRSIYIAAMISAEAAIIMHKFLDLYKNNIYYTDTDSLILDIPLDPQFIGDEIGKFKFVNKIKRGYFIAPKLYLMVLDNDEILIKSKGVNKDLLNENQFIELLHGISQNIPINRFFVNIKKSSVSFIKSYLKISPNLLKREPNYKNGLIVNTKPLKLIDGQVIKFSNFKLNKNLVLYNPKNFQIIKKERDSKLNIILIDNKINIISKE